MSSWISNGRRVINLHLPDVTLASYTNGEIVTGPNRLNFEAMTELIKPVIDSDTEFDKFVEELMSEGRSSIKPKDRPNSEIIVAMVQSS